MMKRTLCVVTVCLVAGPWAGGSLAAEPAPVSIGFAGPQFLALSRGMCHARPGK